MFEFFEPLVMVLGSIALAALLIALLIYVLGVAIPAMWREVCYLGYCAFADKARKAAIRERERAEVARERA